MSGASRQAARHLAAALGLLAALPAAAEAAPPDRSIAAEATDPATVQRFGPAYRYPRAGWVVVHVEGAPYDRGYQHGRLLAAEIADYAHTLATKRSHDAPADAWRETRTMVNALFLRRFDTEYLEEMKGIADGAAAGGARLLGRPIDFLDVACINADIELEFLDTALDATPTGLEGRVFRTPAAGEPAPAPPEHCSAFAATGPATADGKIVFGHITMWSLTFVRHFNVWLDVQPEKGHRVLMQTYPGGIQSGMDYYMNDAGLLVAETTLRQTRFDVNGQSLASRVRKALQYADSIDRAVATLRDRNNGMYTNEWLLADTKTDEIAMFELGTRRSRLWRSSKGEWFGGTEGFYWGCNNAKELEVRLESIPGVEGRPANLVWRPSDRDRAWVRLYRKHRGSIDEAFGFEAFTTPPLSAYPSLDAKFTTSALAKELRTWAVFGPPLGKTWVPSPAELRRFAAAQPLVGNDWTLLSAGRPAAPGDSVAAGGVGRAVHDHARPESGGIPADLPCPSCASKGDTPRPPVRASGPAWHGTILPKDDADVWLAAAFADYEPIVARENALGEGAGGEVAYGLFAPYSHYRTAVARLGKDLPLAEVRARVDDDAWYQIASGKGVLLLAALRDRLGDGPFRALMDEFGRAHAGKAVSTAEFAAAAAARTPDDLAPFFREWLTGTGLPVPALSGYWSIESFEAEPEKAVIVYGTVKESDAQREAASRLQREVERHWSNVTVPILADRDASPDALRGRHVLVVGRPDTNAVAGRLLRHVPVRFGRASFVVRGETYAHPHSAVVAAGAHPDDPRFEVVVFAGLGAEATWRCVATAGERNAPAAEVLILPAGGEPRRLAVAPTGPVAETGPGRTRTRAAAAPASPGS